MPQIRHIWKKPTPRNIDDSAEASWIEIFFDLVFVGAFFNLSHFLGHHLDMHHFIEFLILWSIIFICWWYYVSYQNMFENDDFSNRLFTFAVMFFLVGIIIFIERAFGNGVWYFSVFYIGLRIFFMAMWMRAGLHTPHLQKTISWFSGITLASIGLWIAGIYMSEYRILFWSLAVWVDVLFPILTHTLRQAFKNFHPHKTPERIGTFIMMVIGEGLLSITLGLSGFEDFSLMSVWWIFLSVFTIFGMWWIYFENIADTALSKNNTKRITWFYLHIPLYFCLLLFSVGINAFFYENFTSPFPNIIMGISIGGFFIVSALIQKNLDISKTAISSTMTYIRFWIIAWIMTLILASMIYKSENQTSWLLLLSFIDVLMLIFIILSLVRIAKST